VKELRWVFADRVHERPRVELVSLNADDARGRQLVASLRTWSGDREADSDPELGGLLAARDARKLGTTGRWVSDRLDELRDELERLG
jgi:hypothetical protein